MEYTERQKELSFFFRQMGDEGILPGTGIRVLKVSFNSHEAVNFQPVAKVPGEFMGFFNAEGMKSVNDNFTYYIFMPPSDTKNKGAIILLHGLNERNWEKYLTWGERLASDTGRAVVLFPIAYHMNRSPLTWVDRHLMMPAVAARLLKDPSIRMASFANVALSTRVTLMPQRFFLSGYQAVNDLLSLISQIKSGKHPYIESNGRVDIFAYSIGVMVSQVVLLAGEGGLPSDSRLFFFCGGSPLNRMNGTSKLIMDSRAFERLLSFYIDEIDSPSDSNERNFTDIIHSTPVGLAYYGLSSRQRHASYFGDKFIQEGDRIKTITFENDRVIPPTGISELLTGTDMEIWSPEYEYIHENPFPVSRGETTEQVDIVFDRLFNTAARFLA
jgi:hypothetical protein